MQLQLGAPVLGRPSTTLTPLVGIPGELSRAAARCFCQPRLSASLRARHLTPARLPSRLHTRPPPGGLQELKREAAKKSKEFEAYQNYVLAHGAEAAADEE